MISDNAASHNPEPCKACGHCPTCGRGGNGWVQPYMPYVPYAPYISPWYQYPNTTWTSGGANNTAVMGTVTTTFS